MKGHFICYLGKVIDLCGRFYNINCIWLDQAVGGEVGGRRVIGKRKNVSTYSCDAHTKLISEAANWTQSGTKGSNNDELTHR